MAYQCKSCDDRFLRKSMLDRHTCSSAKVQNDSHKCNNCGECFSSNETLLNHDCKEKTKQVEKKSGPPLVKCQYCGAQFTNENTLRVHVRVHTGDMPYKCQECGAKFPYHSNLRSHMRIHNDPIDRPHKCEKCGAKFSQYANLQAHIRTHTSDRTTTCNKCEGLIPENCNHVCPQESGDSFFKCVECGARFTVKNTLDVHMRTHTGERPYKCNQCDERFIQAGALQSHLRTHTLHLNHECGECGQRFATEEKLRDHVRTHAQFTLHKCTVCQAAFANESRLQLHVKQKHIPGEKRSNCNRCSQSFGTESDLQTHIRTAHSGTDGPKHQCLKCTSSFTTYMLLQNHVRDKHPSPSTPFQNGEFRCDDCGCKYTTQNRLIAHRRVKHPEKSKTVRRPEDNSATTLSQNCTTKSSNNVTTLSQNCTTKPSKDNKQQQNECAEKNSNQKLPEILTEDHGVPEQKDSPSENHDQRQKELLPNNNSADKKELKRKKVNSEEGPTERSSSGAKKSKSFKCKECDEMFDNQYQLHIHEQGHKYEKGCDKCGVRCTCQLDNTSAAKQKRGRKPGTYKCIDCKRKFVGRLQLSQHECRYKGRSGHHHNQKKSHAVQHSVAVTAHVPVLPVIKNQKCPECDVSFARKLLVQLHLLNVHNKSSQDCTICNKLCSQTVPKSGETMNAVAFTCDECAKSSKSNENIRNANVEEKIVSENKNGDLNPLCEAEDNPAKMKNVKKDEEVSTNNNDASVVNQKIMFREMITLKKNAGQTKKINSDEDGDNGLSLIINDMIKKVEEINENISHAQALKHGETKVHYETEDNAANQIQVKKEEVDSTSNNDTSVINQKTMSKQVMILRENADEAKKIDSNNGDYVLDSIIDDMIENDEESLTNIWDTSVINQKTMSKQVMILRENADEAKKIDSNNGDYVLDSIIDDMIENDEESLTNIWDSHTLDNRETKVPYGAEDNTANLIKVKMEEAVSKSNNDISVITQKTMSKERITLKENTDETKKIDSDNSSCVFNSIIDDVIENDKDRENVYDSRALETPECEDDDDDDDDADDTRGVPIIKVKNKEYSGQILDIFEICETSKPGERNKTEDILSIPLCSSTTKNASRLSVLVPKLLEILAHNVEDATLEDFGYPSASAVELLENVICHYGGMPLKNLDTEEETLAANCRELFILTVGSKEAETLLVGRTIAEVIEEAISVSEENGLEL